MLCLDLDAIRNKEAGVEADAKLSDEVGIVLLLLHGLENKRVNKWLRTRASHPQITF